MINTFSNQSNLHQHQQITKSNCTFFFLNWSNVFHWEIIWSFLQGSLGLTQKQPCIRCRFYKVYLIIYKTMIFSFLFLFYWGGGLIFVVIFLEFFLIWTISIMHIKYQYVCVYKYSIFMKIFESAMAMGNRYFTLDFFFSVIY